jgi:hypothetical protein
MIKKYSALFILLLVAHATIAMENTQVQHMERVEGNLLIIPTPFIPLSTLGEETSTTFYRQFTNITQENGQKISLATDEQLAQIKVYSTLRFPESRNWHYDGHPRLGKDTFPAWLPTRILADKQEGSVVELFFENTTKSQAQLFHLYLTCRSYEDERLTGISNFQTTFAELKFSHKMRNKTAEFHYNRSSKPQD